MAREAFAKIQSIVPHDLKEPYSTDHEIYSLAARLYQAAVALYAVLTLPTQLAAIFTFPLDNEKKQLKATSPASGKVPRGILSVHSETAMTVEPANDLRYEHDKLDAVHSRIEEDFHRGARVRYRSCLFRLFRVATVEILEAGGLMWPAAVLGVAFHGQRHMEEQTILLDYIGRQRGAPSSENGAACLYDKLVLFWSSNKSGWNQCFYEPTNVMT